MRAILVLVIGFIMGCGGSETTPANYSAERDTASAQGHDSLGANFEEPNFTWGPDETDTLWSDTLYFVDSFGRLILIE